MHASSTVSGLGCVSVRWSTGMTLPSFSKNTVRPVVSVSANIALDSHLGAASNLNHAVAGIYLCVRLNSQESAT